MTRRPPPSSIFLIFIAAIILVWSVLTLSVSVSGNEKDFGDFEDLYNELSASQEQYDKDQDYTADRVTQRLFTADILIQTGNLFGKLMGLDIKPCFRVAWERMNTSIMATMAAQGYYLAWLNGQNGMTEPSAGGINHVFNWGTTKCSPPSQKPSWLAHRREGG